MVASPGRSAREGSVDLIRCGLRAHEASGAMPTRIGRGGAEQTEPMMMMSASLGRGGGGQAQRATGSSPDSTPVQQLR